MKKCKKKQDFMIVSTVPKSAQSQKAQVTDVKWKGQHTFCLKGGQPTHQSLRHVYRRSVFWAFWSSRSVDYRQRFIGRNLRENSHIPVSLFTRLPSLFQQNQAETRETGRDARFAHLVFKRLFVCPAS